MSAEEACRELATKMTDNDLLPGVVALGPDSPLLPHVRTELKRRLADRNEEPTMSADAAYRELAKKMTDDDLLAGVVALGPDSPLLPYVRTELKRRLADWNEQAAR